MNIRQIEIPWEVLGTVCSEKKLSALMKDGSIPETINAADIKMALEYSDLGELENEVLYHRMETEQLVDAIVSTLGLKDKDFSQYNELVDKDHEETYFLLAYFLKKIQKTMQEQLGRKGNIVHCVAPIHGVPFDDNTLPDAWNVNRNNAQRAIKEVPDDRDPIDEPFQNPIHPGLVTEKHVPYTRTDGEAGILVFAENLSDIDDLDNVINLDLRDGIKVVIDAMHACKFIHEKGLVHRDIKLENIMVDFRGNQINGKLCDHEFIVKEGTHCPEMRGTQKYMDLSWYPYVKTSGEKARKEMDIFAFGMTLLLLPIESEDRDEFLEQLETEFSKRFSYALRNLLDKNPSINTESLAVDNEGYEEFLEAVSKFRLLHFDTVDLVRDLLSELQPTTHVSDRVVELIGKMLSYYRGDRPTLEEAIAVLEEEYEL